MSKNVCGIDRIWRIVLGVLLVVLTLTGVIGWWGWIGVVPIVTGSIGWCPFYMPFRFSTCKGRRG
ncbi:hypothetical protein CUZ56_00282 [Saezia sanguinis]|uniref:Inner membrane protein YgaP-like transmembrane domain-containing protein n=1 Tax=Saezia sanguinis TaxID=1965230 RepID=A0A433SGC9_9BURK|nr:DUF2892 domain-containing protein [Saezia sanguinis]RUS67803.1 hypothetical protein CUZ56_00282 [Saezia sanguinis]